MKLNKKIIAPLAVLLVAPTLLLACSSTNGNTPESKFISLANAKAWLDEHSANAKTATSGTLSWEMDEKYNWGSAYQSIQYTILNYLSLYGDGTFTFSGDFVGSCNNSKEINPINNPWQFNGNTLTSKGILPNNAYVYELSSDEKQLVAFKTNSSANGSYYIKNVFDESACRTTTIKFFECELAGPTSIITGTVSLTFEY